MPAATHSGQPHPSCPVTQVVEFAAKARHLRRRGVRLVARRVAVGLLAAAGAGRLERRLRLRHGIGRGVDAGLGVAHRGVGALGIACRRMADALGCLQIALDPPPLERAVRSRLGFRFDAAGFAFALTVAFGSRGLVGFGLRDGAVSPASTSPNPWARVAALTEQQAGTELLGERVRRRDLREPLGDVGERGRAPMAGQRGALARRASSPVRSRKPIIAVRRSTPARPVTALRCVPHRLGGVGEALDVGRMLRAVTLSAQSTHAGRRIDPDLGGLVALALGLELLD